MNVLVLPHRLRGCFWLVWIINKPFDLGGISIQICFYFLAVVALDGSLTLCII